MLLVAACASAPAPVPDPAPPPARLVGTAVERMEGWFPNCELVTHEGRRVRFYDDLVRGRVVMIHFMYATCDGI